MRILPVSLALLCASCGPPRLTTSDGESGDSSTDSSSGSTDNGSSNDGTTDGSSNDDSTDGSSNDDSTDPNAFLPITDSSLDLSCDPFAQDCPDGEKCVPYASSGGSWDANRCVPVQGNQAAGEPCMFGGIVEATDDCDADSFCWNAQEVDGELLGTCHNFCAGTADMPECPEGSQCLISSEPIVTLCFPQCDPVTQDCADGLGCYWVNVDFTCVLPIDPAVPPGQACGFVNDCEPGGVCLDASVLPSCNDSACCSPFCNLELPGPTCDVLPGTTCVPFFEDGQATPGYEHVGVCILPP